MALIELGQPEDAIEPLAQAASVSPDSDEAWRQLGVALLTAGERMQSVAGVPEGPGSAAGRGHRLAVPSATRFCTVGPRWRDGLNARPAATPRAGARGRRVSDDTAPSASPAIHPSADRSHRRIAGIRRRRRHRKSGLPDLRTWQSDLG